jgi:hypothetical protein
MRSLHRQDSPEGGNARRYAVFTITTVGGSLLAENGTKPHRRPIGGSTIGLADDNDVTHTA